MEKAHKYIQQDIIKSFKWLGNSKYGYTELTAFHKDYKPGREHYRNNFKNGRFPKIWYTKNPKKAVSFVKRYCLEHTCCYGINPRTEILKTDTGYNRSAKDSDISVVINFYFDIDFNVKEPSQEQIAELEMFLVKTEPYFGDLKLVQPVRAFTGRGYHLLFSLAPILVKEHEDIKDRLNYFRKLFQKSFEKELSELELKIDNTMDLKRVAKIYGTKKPTARRISRFYGDKRIEDKILQEYLLGLSIEDKKSYFTKLNIPTSLPKEFERLLEQDIEIKKLWDGVGKTEGDMSNSGYDFSLIKKCLKKNISDINDLAAILALRPKGAIRMSGKGDYYIRLTIANALKP